MDNNNILFIINRGSGKSDTSSFNEVLHSYSLPASAKISVYTITGEQDNQNLERLIEENMPNSVVAVGGDGTVNLAASLIIGKEIKLGIIPSGSANGMASELNIPADPFKALDIIFQGHTRKLDLVRINQQFISIHLCDVGLNARIVKRFEKEGGRGLSGYARQLFKELVMPEKSFVIKFNADGKTIRIKAVMAVVANATKYGTGAIINPTGDLSDGRFELIILRPYPFWFLFKLVYIMFRGSIHRQRFVKVYSFQKVILSLSAPQELQIDGEVQGLQQTIDAEIIPKAIEILVPNA